MTASVSLLYLVVLLACVINIPLGWLRDKTEKFSFGWYVCIHLSIPAIVLARVKAGLGWKFVPFTVAGAVVGQVVGGMIHNRRKKT